MKAQNRNRRILLAIAVVVMLAAAPWGSAQAAPSFTDVKSSDWFYNDVMTLSGKEILGGYPDGTFGPGNPVTLGQFLAIATRLVAGSQIEPSGPGDHWAYGNYRAAVASGLISSMDFAGTARALDAAVAREDMAYILVNIAKANGETLSTLSGIENSIKDFATISASRRDAVLRAYSNGLLTGGSDKNFKPKNQLSRAEVAAVFCRVMNYTPRPAVQVEVTVPTGATPESVRALELVNAERSKRGISALVMDAELVTVAKAKAEDMAVNGYFAHESACYGSVAEMLCTFGVDWSYCAENLAVGQKTPEKVVGDWMGSPCHSEHALSVQFAKTGVATAKDSKGKIYWVQLFAF
jgi:uncharacterized protein YkwD